MVMQIMGSKIARNKEKNSNLNAKIPRENKLLNLYISSQPIKEDELFSFV